MDQNTRTEKPSYVIRNEKNVPPDVSHLVRDLIDSQILKKQIAAYNATEAYPIEIQRFSGLLLDFTLRCERKWGVAPHLPEVILSIQKKEMPVHMQTGDSISGESEFFSRTIFVYDQQTGYEEDKKETNEVIQQLHMLFLRSVIAHEYHHLLSQKFISLHKTKTADVPKVVVERDGLGYYHDKKSGNALEEGLTVLFAYHAQQDRALTEDLPLGTDFYLAFIQKIEETGFLDGVPKEAVSINISEGKTRIFFRYPESVKLVQFLISIIPDFVRIAEQARIEDKTIALARAIESAFRTPTVEERKSGQDPYGLIVTATEETASFVVGQLITKLKQNVPAPTVS